MTPRDHATTIFDCALFLHDFQSLLARERPRTNYPDKSWHQCLCRAVELDNARALKARYAALDVYRIRIQYQQRIHSDGLPRMNGQLLHLSPSSPDIESPILRTTNN